MSLGLCRLCERRRELRKSHIVPRFVSEWMKASGSKFFRSLANPNRRLQDGLKRKLLCDECEQRFSEGERWFAERIFKPVVEGRQGSIAYDHSLHYFLVSVLWRTLCLDMDHDTFDESHPHHDAVVRTHAVWRDYLRGGLFRGDMSEVHLFVTDLGNTSQTQPVVNLNLYFTRAVDSTLAASAKKC